MNRREAIKTMTLTGAALATGLPFRTASAAAESEGPFTLPALGYPTDALEPAIDARTMEIHHTKHHAGYVRKLNRAVQGHPELAGKSVEDLLRMIDTIPEDIRTAVRNNGGGHANHSLFWTVMKKGGASAPRGELATALEILGGMDGFRDAFSQAAAGRFGSGWAWLCVQPDRTLHITSTPNQDSPYMAGHIPILGLDVWEHAYYLQYQNRRGDYIQAWLDIIDWDQVSANYAEATAG